MFFKLKHLLIGSPLPTYQLAEKRLNKIRGMAIFSPAAISSIAYANQEIFLSLVAAGAVGLTFSLPLGLSITGLLIIVSISYMQIIRAYPSGGGSYVVAKENLGTLPGLIAAGALLLDYLLTSAVSITAAVDALASAFPVLWGLRVWIALFILVLMTLANLRGVRESGTLMAVPVYLFLVSFGIMLLVGFIRLLTNGIVPMESVAPQATTPLTLFLILHAFSTGCTAITGVEAISNGVTVFKEPVIRNANRTMMIMAVCMMVLFVGSISLTQFLAIIPNTQETILSALARNLFGNGFFYYLIQCTTMLILAVAANTSFAGFPRLAAILSGDSFLPRQLKQIGDRLVFNNGILLLAIGTALLIIVFQGDTHLLIPLFAVGVFLAFTLSQAGMVVHWMRNKEKLWRFKAVVNGAGMLATALTLIIVGVSKFIEGAWISILLLFLFVRFFRKNALHYKEVSMQLSLKGVPPSLKTLPHPRIMIPISSVHRGVVVAVNYARSISNDITALYVALDPESEKEVKENWVAWFPDIPFISKPSPFRSVIAPLLEMMDEEDQRRNDGQLGTIVIPEFIPAHWWQNILHNQTSWLIKTTLLYRRRHMGFQRAIIDIPIHLRD